MYKLGGFAKQSPSACLTDLSGHLRGSSGAGSVLCASGDLTHKSQVSPEIHGAASVQAGKSRLRGSEFCASLLRLQKLRGNRGYCAISFAPLYFFNFFFTVGPGWHLTYSNVYILIQTPNLSLVTTLPSVTINSFPVSVNLVVLQISSFVPFF